MQEDKGYICPEFYVQNISDFGSFGNQTIGAPTFQLFIETEAYWIWD